MPLASGPNAPRGKGKFFGETISLQDEEFKRLDQRAKHGYPPTQRCMRIITRERYEQIKETLSPQARKQIEAAFDARRA